MQGSEADGSFLPSGLYTSEEMDLWDRRQYARRFWHPIAATSSLRPGQTMAVSLLGMPLLVSWPETGKPRAFINRCPHRGVAFQTADQPATSCRRLICPYHGWTYNLNGELLAAAREQEFLEPFERAEWSLSPWPCKVDGPLIWVAFDQDAIPLDEQLELIHREADVAWSARLTEQRRHRLNLGCNWKIAHDNTLDDYHVAIAHPTTLHREQGPVRHYRHRFSRYVNLLETPHPDGGDFQTFGLPPWTHVLVWPDQRMVLLEFIPEQADRCSLQLRLFSPAHDDDPAAIDAWLQQLLTFLEEDRRLVESAQRGYSSGLQPGPAHRLEQRILHWEGIYRHQLPGAEHLKDDRSQDAISAFSA